MSSESLGVLGRDRLESQEQEASDLCLLKSLLCGLLVSGSVEEVKSWSSLRVYLIKQLMGQIILLLFYHIVHSKIQLHIRLESVKYKTLLESNMKTILCIFEVTLKRVSIEIKFPCSLQVSFKIGKEEVQTPTTFKLLNGQASMGETLSLKGTLTLDSTNQYQEKKGVLTVYVVSHSGKNVAGMAYLDLGGVMNDPKLGLNLESTLERCPDRKARIELDLVAKVQDSNESRESHPSNVSFFSAINRDREGSSSFYNFAKMGMQGRPPRPHFSSMDNLKIPLEEDGFVVRVDHVETFQPREPMLDSAYFLETSRRDLSESSKSMTNLKMQLTDKDRKITRLEIERNAFHKENDILKGQLSSLKSKSTAKSMRESELTFENQRLSKEILALETALESSKNRKEDYRRQESFSTKYSSEQLAYRSEKLDQLQIEAKNLRVTREEGERLFREAKRECREAQEKSEDLQTAFNTLQKRLDLKETFYKEELRKYNLTQIELQNSKTELNSEVERLKESFEEMERRLGHSVREKEKILGDERSKSSRKNLEIKGEVEVLSKEIACLKDKLKSTLETNEKLGRGQKEKEGEMMRLQQELVRLRRSTVANEELLKKNFEEELETYKFKETSMKQEQEQLLSRHNLEVEQLAADANEKAQTVKQLSTKMADLRSQLREKEQRIAELSRSVESVSKRIEATKKSQDKLSTELDDLKRDFSMTKMQLNKVSIEKHELENYSNNTKEHHSKLIQQLKVMIKELSEEVEMGKSTCRIMEEERVESFLEIRRLTEQNEKASSLILTLNGQQQLITAGQGETLLQVKKLEGEIDRLRMVIAEEKDLHTKQCEVSSNLQSRLSKLKEDNLELTSNLDRMKRLQRLVVEKEQDLKSQHEKQMQLEAQALKNQYMLKALQEEMKAKVAENERERAIIEGIKAENTSLLDQLQTVRRSDSGRVEEIHKLQLQKSRNEAERKIIEGNFESMAMDFRRQNKLWMERLREFVDSIHKDEKTERPSGSENIQEEIQGLMRDAYSKLHVFKRIQDRQWSLKVEAVQKRLTEVEEQQIEAMRQKEHETTAKIQIIKQECTLIKENQRVKMVQADEEISSLARNLDMSLLELNTAITEKETVVNLYQESLIRIEELQTYLQQAQREIHRIAEERDGLTEELEGEREDKNQQLRRINTESISKLEVRENHLQLQLEQLDRDLKDKKRVIEDIQGQNKNLARDLEYCEQQLQVSEKRVQSLKSEIGLLTQEAANSRKKEREVLERGREVEQSLQLAEERLSQCVVSAELRQKEFDDLKSKSEKQKQLLSRKISIYQSEIKKMDEKHDTQVRQITEECAALKEALQRSGRGGEHEARKKEEKLAEVTQQLTSCKNQMNVLESEFSQYKTLTKSAGKSMQEEMQKGKAALQASDKKLNNTTSQLKLLEEKCASLESERSQMLQRQSIPQPQVQRVMSENQRLRQDLESLSNKSQLEIMELLKCKASLLAEVERLNEFHQEHMAETEQHYDREIRQLTARMVQMTSDADQRIKRAYKDKYEDRSLLEFQIQCLRQELAKYTDVKVEKNSLSRDEFVMEVADAKMKLFIAEEPLRNIEGWIPSLLNEIKQYEQTILTHEKLIKMLQKQLDQQIRINDQQTKTPSPNSQLSTHSNPRRSTFFPLSVMNQTFKSAGVNATIIIQKLEQIQENVNIALRRVQSLASDLESVTQDKMLVLVMARNAYTALSHNHLEHVKNELASMLDYSKIAFGAQHVRVNKQ